MTRMSETAYSALAPFKTYHESLGVLGPPKQICSNLLITTRQPHLHTTSKQEAVRVMLPPSDHFVKIVGENRQLSTSLSQHLQRLEEQSRSVNLLEREIDWHKETLAAATKKHTEMISTIEAQDKLLNNTHEITKRLTQTNNEQQQTLIVLRSQLELHMIITSDPNIKRRRASIS